MPVADIRCISFDSYIKPQLWYIQVSGIRRCISFDSYIKPQPILGKLLSISVDCSKSNIKNGSVGLTSYAKVLKNL